MQELFSTLGIQWSLLIAQIVNFAILLVVLRAFVYRPLLDLIEKRRQMVQASMDTVSEVDKMRQQAEQERTDLLRKADQEAGAILERAKTQAQTMRTEIETTAHREAEQLLQKGRQQLENERSKVFTDVQQTLAKVIVTATEKILKREFSAADQDRMMKDLEKNLPSMLS